MYITRGTNPKHFFSVPTTEENTWSVTIVYSQANNSFELTRQWICPDYSVGTNQQLSANVAFSKTDKHTIIVDLLADDTKQIDPKHFVKVQITVIEKKEIEKDPDGNPTYGVGDIHKSEFLYLSVLDDLSIPYPPN